MKVHSTHKTSEKILDLLKRDQDFCYTRYGDTQLMMLDGWYGHKHEQLNNPKLRLLLTKAFQVNDPDYLIAPACGYLLEPGMTNGTFHLYANDTQMVQTVERLKTGDEFWHCEALHYGMLYDQELVKSIFREIEKRDVLIVAGNELDPRKIAFKNADFIGIPMDNAFKYWEAIYRRMQEYQPEIILFSAGPTAQVLQYFQFLDRPQATTINMGSVFNGLLNITQGPHTRAWIRLNQDRIKQFNASL